jgi:beta-aspartyl-peptidase (threonine type)
LVAEDLLTDAARATWEAGLAGTLAGEGTTADVMLSRVASLATDPERAAGTVNFIAQDGAGHLASAVSTSGWAWKYPGRLGDSPVIGAGNYCDDRYGAAACTGWGELSLRALTARSVVASLAAGASLVGACAAAMHDLATLGIPSADVLMHLVAVDAGGGHHGVTTRSSGATYVWRGDGMSSYEVAPRTVVPV